MTVPQQLKKIRAIKKWTQGKMAEELGLKSQQVYRNYENGVNQKFTPAMLEWVRINYETVRPLIEVEEGSSKILEALIRVESRLTVHDAYLAEIFSKLSKPSVPATKVLRDMEQMANEVSRKLQDGLKS